MAAPAKVDTAAWNRMCHGIARMSGTPFAKVVDYEAAKVLEKTLTAIPAAKVADIGAAHDRAKFTAVAVSRLTGPAEGERIHKNQYGTFSRRSSRKKGGETHSGPKRIYNLSYHYPDRVWQAIVESRAAGLKRKLHARGLSKRAILSLARSMGFEIRAPGFVRKAVATTGKVYANETVVRKGGIGRYGIFIASRMPVLGTAHVAGQRRFNAAIAGRVRYFQQNLKRKVFESAAAFAKRYPGIKTTTV